MTTTTTTSATATPDPHQELVRSRVACVRQCFEKCTDGGGSSSNNGGVPLLSMVDDAVHGVHVVASTTTRSKNNNNTVLARKRLIGSCPAAAMALEPSRRRTHCGFCSRSISTGYSCCPCNVVVACDKCQSSSTTSSQQQQQYWHKSSGECVMFQALVQAVGNDNESSSLDSCLLLTMRLLFRKWYDDVYTNDRNNATATTTQGQGRSKTTATYNTPPTRIDWQLFDNLYPSPTCCSHQNDAAADSVEWLLGHVSQALQQRLSAVDRRTSSLSSFWTLETFEYVYKRVVGCSHAIVDVTLPLGEQTLGRALYLNHSFYNHACQPNAYLSSSSSSCGDTDDVEDDDGAACVLVGRVHLLRDVTMPNEAITLSYLPMSGLCKAERQAKLQEGYDFTCSCQTCMNNVHEDSLKLAGESNVDDVRQVQYCCHADLLHIENCNAESHGDATCDECPSLESILATLDMLQRGLKNQGIPKGHEVSIELHRLLAKAYTLTGDVTKAIRHHEECLDAVSSISGLFDPVTEAKQRLEYSNCLLLRNANDDNRLRCRRQLCFALQCATPALGEDHDFVQDIQRRLDGFAASRKRKANNLSDV